VTGKQIKFLLTLGSIDHLRCDTIVCTCLTKIMFKSACGFSPVLVLWYNGTVHFVLWFVIKIKIQNVCLLEQKYDWICIHVYVHI
jgi:hypothetical protein